MESFSHFHSIDELVKMFDRERVLFRDMFERRKSLAYRLDFALEIVEYKRDRIQFMIDHGVISENGDFIELEDVYVRFFEDVLDMNEEISVESVREYISSLRENINYYLEESNEHRKLQYHANIRKIMRRIGLRTLKNVVDLKRNVDVAYKQEPNYKIKKSRLVNLDEKRRNIKTLMKECEKIMDQEIVFFRIMGDAELQRTCMDVRNDFTEADHNLLEIERQIIAYINRIEQQSLLFRKIRRLKYLKDQLTWREDSNIAEIFDSCQPLWLEKRPYNRIFLSLDRLGSDEMLIPLIRRLGDRINIRRRGCTEAEPLTADFLHDTEELTMAVNVTEMWNAFKAQGADLFNFIRNYTYREHRTLNDHIVLFCQMAVNYSGELRMTDKYERFENVEYAMIYAS